MNRMRNIFGHGKYLSALLIGVAALSALAVACGSDEEAPAAASTPIPTAAAVSTAAPAPTASGSEVATARPALVAPMLAPAAAQQGGIFKVGYFRNASSPDGFQAGGTFDRMYFYTGMEPLVAIDENKGFAADESIAYAFEVLDNGARVRFFIREGIQFQGGFGEVTADDVVWNLNRWFDPDTNCRCSSSFRSVTEVNKVDDFTVDIVMDPPDANLVAKMFDRAAIIHSKENWDALGGAEGHKSAPISTGPYRLTDWDVGNKQTWEAHPDWWRGTPNADGVEVIIISETRTRLAALETGALNVAWLQAEMIPQAESHSDIQVWSFTGVGWDGWTWNHGLAPLDDLRLRRALIKSVDRDAINKGIYLDTLRPSTAHTFPPESIFGIDADDLWQGPLLKLDVDAAKALVAEVAADKGLDLPLQIKGVCERRPDRQQFCEFLQGAWSEIDVDFDFQIVSNATERTAVMEQCQTHMTQTGSGMLLPHFMEGSLISSALGNFPQTTCKENSALSPEEQVVQDELDNLLEGASQEFDEAKRAELYKKVQRVALENLFTYVPAMLRVNYIGCHIPTTGGCDENPMRGDGFVRNGDFWLK
jgi:ABC-type transport system substrate-binding protein